MARDDPLRSNAKGASPPLSRSPHADLKAGSDLNCPGAPRQKKPTALRFRRGDESSVSVGAFFLSETVGAFFLSETELSRGSSVSVMWGGKSVMNTRTKPTKSEPDLPCGRRVRILCFLQQSVFSPTVRSAVPNPNSRLSFVPAAEGQQQGSRAEGKQQRESRAVSSRGGIITPAIIHPQTTADPVLPE